MDSIIIYTDGACSGNPGPGGWGSVVYVPSGKMNQGIVTELSGYLAPTTNNQMELQSVISALKFVAPTDNEIIVYTDSTYVIRGMTQWIFAWKNRGWKTAEGKDVSNKSLWIELESVVKKCSKKIQWKYVRGHQGIHGNERCDALAVAESKREFIEKYSGASEYYFFDILETPLTEPLPEMKGKKTDSTGNLKPADVSYLSYINGVLYRDKTWSACEARIKGRPGVVFKKVKNESEEKECLAKWGIK